MTNEKFISVIIPTYNRCNILNEVLHSYIYQKNVKEIVIIDDNSTENYRNLVNYYQDLCYKENINFIYYKNGSNVGAAGCRNIGIKLCNFEYILWGEDDAFLNSDYTEVLLEKIDDKSIIFGSIYYNITISDSIEDRENKIKSQQKLNKKIFDFKYIEGYYRKKYNGLFKVPFGHSIILVPKKAYNNVEYFTDYKVNGYREESDGQIQMYNFGINIFYSSDTMCFHYPRKMTIGGGQHKHNYLKKEIYKVINNYKFINRNHEIIKEHFLVNKSKFILNLMFIFKIVNDNLGKVFRRIFK